MARTNECLDALTMCCSFVRTTNPINKVLITHLTTLAHNMKATSTWCNLRYQIALMKGLPFKPLLIQPLSFYTRKGLLTAPTFQYNLLLKAPNLPKEPIKDILIILPKYLLNTLLSNKYDEFPFFLIWSLHLHSYYNQIRKFTLIAIVLFLRFSSSELIARQMKISISFS